MLTAESGELALQQLATNDVWVLFTDQRMPGMSGIDLLETTSQRYPEVVRVIVSAYSDTPRILDALRRGHAHE